MDRTVPVSLAINKISRQIKRYIDKSKKLSDSHDKSTHNQSRIIGYIHVNSGRDVFQRDIEKEFNIRRSTATNTLKLMEKNGLITRERVDYDERLKKIMLTASSMESANEIQTNVERLSKIIEKGITDEERKTFFDVIEKIENNIREVESDD